MKKIYLLSFILTFCLGSAVMSYAQTSTTFNYTGAMDTYVVPAGVTSVDVDVIAASGGFPFWSGSLQTQQIPGDGGRVQTTLTVTPGETLYIYVGGQGGDAAAGTGGTPGYNGGGDGGYYSPSSGGGGGGGGASDIRQGGMTVNDRVVVAGGGGGSAYNYGSGDDGGHGGDLTGANGESNNNPGDVSTGKGGTQSAGGQGGQWSGYPAGADGSFGQGGYGAFSNTTGGGGGGGYYGGGGGSWSGGGGGSSYADAAVTSSTTHTQGYNTGDGQIIITINCNPLTTSVSSSTVCDGEMVTLDATSSGTGTVTWDNGVSNGVPFTPPVGTTTYTATSTDGNDCGFAVDITVNALPTVVASVDKTVICLGDTVVFTGSGASTYMWDNGVTDGADFVPGASGNTTYTVTGTDANGCENTDNIDVMVSDLSVTAVITHENTGNDGAIDITPVNGTGTYTYTWSSGPTTEDITGLTVGSYTVSIDDGGCTFDSTFTIINVAGVEESALNGLEVYPNPTNGILTIDIDGQFSYQIINVIGEVIITDAGFGTTTVDLSELSRGSYFIKVFANDEYKTIKVIKR